MAETVCGHRGPAKPKTLSVWPITEKMLADLRIMVMEWLWNSYGAIY